MFLSTLVVPAWATDAARPPLTFTLRASAAEYTTKDPIRFDLSIALDPSATARVSVCTSAILSIHVATAMRNGRKIKPDRRIVFFEEDPSVFCGHPSSTPGSLDGLIPLNPGATVAIFYEVLRRADGSWELRDVILSKSVDLPHMVDIYPLTVPGTYTIGLHYRYSGASGGRTDVFRGTLTSNSVTFDLVH